LTAIAGPTSCLQAQRASLLDYVERQVRDSSLSEDIVQEAYLRLLSFEAKPDNVVNDRPALNAGSSSGGSDLKPASIPSGRRPRRPNVRSTRGGDGA
jgi:hypothetical protein